MTTATAATTNRTTEKETGTNPAALEVCKGRPETELRAAARRRGLTMKELAKKMGVSEGYLSQIANGGRPWTPKMREKVAAVLGEVPGQGTVYRQGGVVTGESSFIRERAREMGMTMRDLSDRAGVSYSYMTEVSRGRRSMGVRVQARVEAALEAPPRVAPAQCAGVDQQVLWDRMDAHGISQNEVARRAGVSSSHLSQIMNGKASPSAGVLKRLHGVLFQRTAAERVMPAEVKVLGWRKGESSGMVVRGAGGPGRGDGGGAVRLGGRVPEGAVVEYAYRAGYDGRGRVSVDHVVAPGYSAMLRRPDAA